ncbi:MAG: ParB/RepB/Spo0J family partition protein [Chloroflexota bacterium]
MATTAIRAAASPERPESGSPLLRKSGRIEPMLIDALQENPWQPRLSIAPHELEDLKKSIVDFGFMGYVPVRRSDPDDPSSPLEIVYGHRRVLAARMLGMQTVPAMLCDLDDAAMMRLGFVENSTQKKMTYWEEALHFQEMREQLGLSVRKLAEMLGLSRNYVHSRLTLLGLPPGSPMRVAAERNDITMANALAFANLSRTLDAHHLETLLNDLRKGTISLDDLQALDRSLARFYEISGGDPDDDGAAPAPAPERTRSATTLVEQARRGELRAAREAAAIEERRVRRDAAAATEAAAVTTSAAPAAADTPASPGASRRSAATPAPARDGLTYARETLEQLRGVLVHLRPRVAKADFGRLEPSERAELQAMRAELARLLADA